MICDSSHLMGNLDTVYAPVLDAEERVARRTKPHNGQEVAAPLRRLSGSRHQVSANDVGLESRLPKTKERMECNNEAGYTRSR